MRRFSQRNSLVTLSEINITPLLDLAFVLLIIFVITRPMLEGHVKMQLPESSQANDRRVDWHDVHVVEVGLDGRYSLDKKPVTLPVLETDLVRIFRENPKLVVDLRTPKKAEFDNFFKVTEICRRNHIINVSINTAPAGTR